MSDKFYKRQLKNRQAKLYYDLMRIQTEQGNVSGIFDLPISDAETAIQDGFEAIKALKTDRPDFFHLGSVTRAVHKGNSLRIKNAVLYTPQQTLRLKKLLAHTLKKLTTGTQLMPAWDRERIVYERVAHLATYKNHGESHDHNIVGPIIKKSGVCESFSCILILALREAGIPCIKVSGFGKNESHCWNMAWIDGVPCHLDVTWETKTKNSVGYFYFNLTDKDIERDHTITTKALPQCRDSSFGYFEKTQSTFNTSLNASRYISKAFRRGCEFVRVKLNENGSIEDCIRFGISIAPPGSYSYQYNETQQVALVYRNS